MLYRNDQPVDFRALIHELGLPGMRLHPVDGQRYLTPSGMAIMAEGLAAEVASPPVSLGPGFARELDSWSAHAFAQLRRPLDSEIRLKGRSTHLSVECDPRIVDEVAWLYAQTFAPAIMLLLDDAESPGLLVRARPSRLELCGEFATDSRLRSAAALAAGSVLALSDALRSGRATQPPRLRGTIETARRRFGWYVDRRAFGPDLYDQGRSSVLRRVDGGTISGQDQLEACWDSARSALIDRGWTDSLEDADRIVSGDRSLPCERPVDDRRKPATHEPPPAHPIGRMLTTRRRPGFTIQVTSATWDYAAFTVSNGDREAICSVPRPVLGTFLSQLEAGELDDILIDSIESGRSDQTLARHAQTLRPGLWARISTSSALLPVDRPGVGGGAVGRVDTASSAPAAEISTSAGGDSKYPGTRSGVQSKYTGVHIPVGGTASDAGEAPRSATAVGGGLWSRLPATWIAGGLAFLVLLFAVGAGLAFLPGGGQSEAPSDGVSSTAEPITPTDDDPPDGSTSPGAATAGAAETTDSNDSEQPVPQPTDAPSTGAGSDPPVTSPPPTETAPEPPPPESPPEPPPTETAPEPPPPETPPEPPPNETPPEPPPTAATPTLPPGITPVAIIPLLNGFQAIYVGPVSATSCDVLIVQFFVFDPDGNPVAGTTFFSTLGNPPGGPNASHVSGVLDAQGQITMVLNVNEPSGTASVLWFSFLDALYQAVSFAVD